MVFNSLTFLVFFAFVLGVHHLPLSWRFKKAHLLAASYLFYAAWNPPFVALLVISTGVDWHAARRMHRARTTFERRVWLLTSLTTNLGLLGFFKYGGFLLENFQAFCGAMGVAYQPPTLDIVLPVGISFYTFQTLSYTIDVYRGRMDPWESRLDFALFVSFFPQLVAGPIVRASEFLPQCSAPRRADARRLGWGLGLLLIGLFQKVILADAFAAPIADLVYDQAPLAGFGAAWLGTLAFSAQIFCDFAGYSTCAIGAAMCLGFAIPDNFRSPYAAIGFSDFWQRWHISLSGWLRDYLYIPLGGNRGGERRTYINLALTMLLGGLWHGASWRFVVWGALHGLFLAVERWLKSRGIRLFPEGARFGTLGAILGTYGLVCVTWVFFRAESFGDAFAIVAAMVGLGEGGLTLGGMNVLTVLGLTVGLLGVHGWMRDKTLEEAVERVPWWMRSVVLAGMLIALALAPGDERAFIYFQF